MKLPLGSQPGRPLWTAWASFWVYKNESGPNLGPKLGPIEIENKKIIIIIIIVITIIVKITIR